MSGLKTYLPSLADHLGVSADALYERQRKLMRAGLLAASTGRGPGSGIRVTPRAVSLVIIAVMATDELGGIDAAVQDAAAQPSLSVRCPLTGEKNFGDALALILSSNETASMVQSVVFERGIQHGEIIFRRMGNKSLQTSSFGSKLNEGAAPKKLRRILNLPGEAVQFMQTDLSLMLL